MDYILIGEAILGGLVYSLSGLANKPSKEKFDWKKAAPTIIISVAVGAIAGFTGQDFGVVMNGAMAAGISAVVQKFWSAIAKKF